MQNQAINSQELTPRKLQSLQSELLAIQAPYHKALFDVMSVSMPSMIINTETGDITRTYDDVTQKIIDNINHDIKNVTDLFFSANGLVQS